MIRKTLAATQAATFAVCLPNVRLSRMPYPTGTGFFVSGEGWFATAAHVVTANGKPDGPVRDDLDGGWFMKPGRPGQFSEGMCQFYKLDHVDPKNDFALFKVDFAKNSNKEWLKDKSSFPFIQVSSRLLEEGEPVYAFGYPLPRLDSFSADPLMATGFASLAPRVTSAIVSSTFEKSLMASSGNESQQYVLDKALNYGNSGGPIVAVETGKVFALCSHFQPMEVPQPELSRLVGKSMSVVIPSLYSVVSGLANPEILDALKKRGIVVASE